MPRLRQVPRAEAPVNVLAFYDQLFGARDPVAQPGTATGSPGDWWTTYALVPYIFDHAVAHFSIFGMFAKRGVSKLDPRLRELGILRAGYLAGSRFVFSQHCKAARRVGLAERKINDIPHWAASTIYDAGERIALAYVDAVVLEHGRVPDGLFEALKQTLSDEDILEFTYHVTGYAAHATMCRALRLEFDDVPERVTEVAPPADGALTASGAAAGERRAGEENNAGPDSR